MNNEIYIYASPTELTRNIVTPSQTTYSFNAEEFAEGVINLCESENIYKVHLIGADDYVNGLAEEIELADVQKYSFKKIEIEVN